MVGKPMPLDPVFLSASVPDPARHRRYFETGNAIAIRDAVIALVSVTLPHTRLVFGGHPAITPMVKWVADQLNLFPRVRMYQSMFFREHYIQDIEVFRYIEVPAVDNDREKSLLEMRRVMIHSEPKLSAAFFIGGMEGVEAEYGLLRDERPDVPRYPVASTGGAAAILWEKEEARHPGWLALREETAYAALFTALLGISI